jgi:hypothetical protein
VHPKGKTSELFMLPMCFDSKTAFNEWKSAKRDMSEYPEYKGHTYVYHWYVGRSGGHEEGGMNGTTAGVVDDYIHGKPVRLEQLPKAQIFVQDH